MHKHAIGGAIAVMCLMSTAAPAQTSAPPAPASKKAPAKTWTAPKTGWGDPDLSGVYTNNDESLIPFERPAEFAGRKLEDVTRAELEKLIDERDAQRAEADRNRAELRSPLHWFENLFPNNSRAWLVSDPPDGKVPPLTPEAQQRNAARARTGRPRPRGLLRGSQPVRPLHLARDPGLDDARHLRQRL